MTRFFSEEINQLLLMMFSLQVASWLNTFMSQIFQTHMGAYQHFKRVDIVFLIKLPYRIINVSFLELSAVENHIFSIIQSTYIHSLDTIILKSWQPLMSSFKRKTLRVDFQFLLVPGLSKWGECPGMSPGRGKYLACQSCERATLKKRKEMRDPLICLCTLLWRWSKCSYLTHTTLWFVCTCICVCVCVCVHACVCVCV